MESSCRRPFLFERKPGMKNTFDKSESWNQQRYAYGINDELITWKSSWIKSGDASTENSDQTIGKHMTLTFSTAAQNHNSYSDYDLTYGTNTPISHEKFYDGSTKQRCDDFSKKNETKRLETQENNDSPMIPQQQQRPSHQGDHPDISWRAIPMHHLRRHPRFVTLPNSFSITNLASLRDISLFRQDSWQWSALQAGRYTPSICPFVLGLLEPIAGGKVLKLPTKLISSRGQSRTNAFLKLRAKNLLLSDETDLNDLCAQNRQTRAVDDFSSIGSSSDDSSDEDRDEIWVKFKRPRVRAKAKPYASRYYPRLAPAKERLFLDELRRDCIAATSNGTCAGDDIQSIKKEWEREQKPTAILTVLNYFHSLDPRIIIEECGMHVTSLHDNDDKCLLGASPDAIIRHPNGLIEALEVKNKCPFFRSSNKKPYLFYTIHQQVDSDGKTIPPLNIPGMMLKMYCLGPGCRSAIMIRQTATKGAILYRLHRDDEFIEDMLFFLSKFKKDFIDQQVKLPRNFFWVDEDYSIRQRYRRFVTRLKNVQEECVDVLTYIPHNNIQRVQKAHGEKGTISLFLD